MNHGLVEAKQIINWAKPVAEIYNMIRAGNPQPGAWTTYGRQELKVFDSCLAEAGGCHRIIPGICGGCW